MTLHIEQDKCQEKISGKNRYQTLFKLNSSIMTLHIKQDKHDIRKVRNIK